MGDISEGVPNTLQPAKRIKNKNRKFKNLGGWRRRGNPYCRVQSTDEHDCRGRFRLGGGTDAAPFPALNVYKQNMMLGSINHDVGKGLVTSSVAEPRIFLFGSGFTEPKI